MVIASPAQGFTNGSGRRPASVPTAGWWSSQATVATARGSSPRTRPAAARKIIRLAGRARRIHRLQPARRRAVNNTESTECGSTVAFMATSNLGTGIYTTRISFFGDEPNDFDPDDPQRRSGERGDPGGATWTTWSIRRTGTYIPPSRSRALSLWDGINNANRGEIAFWTQLSDHSQEIFKAEPRPVVWIEFDPSSLAPPGETRHEPGTTEPDGHHELGWSGDFEESLEALGFATDFGAVRNADRGRRPGVLHGRGVGRPGAGPRETRSRRISPTGERFPWNPDLTRMATRSRTGCFKRCSWGAVLPMAAATWAWRRRRTRSPAGSTSSTRSPTTRRSSSAIGSSTRSTPAPHRQPFPGGQVEAVATVDRPRGRP